ncbi:MAG: pyruvate kinase, partial [Magnetospirillum sp.]
QKAVHYAQSEGFAKLGDRVIITAGVPFGFSGTTNILRVAEIEDPTVPHGPYRPHHSD